MKTVIFTPYGSLSKESGLIHLVANYVGTVIGGVSALRCNGIFSLCDRDEETSWTRNLESCAICMTNQAQYANWAAAEILDLSLYLNSDEIVATKRWMHNLSTQSLLSACFKEVNLYQLSKESLSLRLGVAGPDLANKKHEQITRRVLLSAARMCLATARFNNKYAPDLVLVANGQDFISKAFIVQSQNQKRDIATFSVDINERCIKIRHPKTGKLFTCELLITDISNMRSDSRTWPKEILVMLDDVLNFLDISQSQIPLPLAR
jgi:hypothetical protein